MPEVAPLLVIPHSFIDRSRVDRRAGIGTLHTAAPCQRAIRFDSRSLRDRRGRGEAETGWMGVGTWGGGHAGEALFSSRSPYPPAERRRPVNQATTRTLTVCFLRFRARSPSSPEGEPWAPRLRSMVADSAGRISEMGKSGGVAGENWQLFRRLRREGSEWKRLSQARMGDAIPCWMDYLLVAFGWLVLRLCRRWGQAGLGRMRGSQRSLGDCWAC